MCECASVVVSGRGSESVISRLSVRVLVFEGVRLWVYMCAFVFMGEYVCLCVFVCVCFWLFFSFFSFCVCLNVSKYAWMRK